MSNGRHVTRIITHVRWIGGRCIYAFRCLTTADYEGAAPSSMTPISVSASEMDLIADEIVSYYVGTADALAVGEIVRFIEV